MTCAEFKELVQAYALDALEPDERAACNEHLADATHDGCLEELDRALAAMAAMADALPPVRPPARVWSAIEQRLRPQTAHERRRVPPVFFAGIAALAAAAAAGFFYVRANDLEGQLAERERFTTVVRADVDKVKAVLTGCQNDLASARDQLRLREEAVALLKLPGTQVVALAPQGGRAMHARVVVNLAERRGLVVATGLAPTAGKDYELWVIRGDQKLAAGLLRGTGDAIAEIDPALLASADAFAVTLEPEGGGPAPRGEIVLVGLLPKT